MADWTTIADSQVDPKAPVTSELMTALRDNPLAIAQGSANAPRIAEKIQSAQGLNEDWANITGLDEASGVYVDIFAHVQTGEFNGATIELQVSTDGSTFSGSTTIRTINASGGVSVVLGSLFVDFTSGSWFMAGLYESSTPTASVTSGTLSGAPLAIKSIRLRALGDSNSSDIAIVARAQGGLAAV